MANVETRMRLVLGNLISDAGALRKVLEDVVEAADREYIAREIDKLQAATHRIVAFLDGVQGEPRN